MSSDFEVLESMNRKSDEDLIFSVRRGDAEAESELYARHFNGAVWVAYKMTYNFQQSEDLASEGIQKVLAMVRTGRGPDTHFRAYLQSTVSRLVYSWQKMDRSLSLVAEFSFLDNQLTSVDPVISNFEHALVARAFGSLTNRWQFVLWSMDVEGDTPSTLALIMGLSPNAVSALAMRAREGLREAYLQHHIKMPADHDCHHAWKYLAAFTRGRVTPRRRQKIEVHLQKCTSCSLDAEYLRFLNRF